MYGDQFGEFACGSWGLKGINWPIIVKIPSTGGDPEPGFQHFFVDRFNEKFSSVCGAG